MKHLAITVAVLGGLVIADKVGLLGNKPLDDRAKYDGTPCRVIRIIDGDTLDVAIPDGQLRHTRIRLWGVDTPETVHPNKPVGHYGPEAAIFTARLAAYRDVTLQLEPTGRTRDNAERNRLLAYVILPDGKMLNAELIAQGYGYADPRYDHYLAAEFAALQLTARQARLGLWATVTNDDLPHYYRDKLQLPAPVPAESASP